MTSNSDKLHELSDFMLNMVSEAVEGAAALGKEAKELWEKGNANSAAMFKMQQAHQCMLNALVTSQVATCNELTALSMQLEENRG